MAEESDARIERLEKASQDQQGQMTKMMEMLKTLVRDKAQAASQQSSVVYLDQRKEDPAFPQGFTPHMCKRSPCLKREGSHIATRLPRHRCTK